ncbi:MAG: hypothetical protein NVS3B20_07390 [Polyangiales bacterium]
MEDVDLAEYGLESLEGELTTLRVNCLSGQMSAAWHDSASWLGGFPCVGPDFLWPMNSGRPLSFVAQLSLHDLGLKHDGAFLLFHDRNTTGYQKDDAAGFRLLYQRAVRQLGESDAPKEGKARSILGVFSGASSLAVWQRIGLKFEHAICYPTFVECDSEVERVIRSRDPDSAYIDLCQQVNPKVQVWGAPSQGDGWFVREQCATRLGVPPLECELLLSLESVNDMVFGDLGSLSWYVRRDDIAQARFGTVWVMMTS